MNDGTAIVGRPINDLADVSALAEEFSKATRLTRYQEGLRDETIRRQKTDLLTFARFLHSIGVQVGDFDAIPNLGSPALPVLSNKEKAASAGLLRLRTLTQCVRDDFWGEHPSMPFYIGFLVDQHNS